MKRRQFIASISALTLLPATAFAHKTNKKHKHTKKKKAPPTSPTNTEQHQQKIEDVLALRAQEQENWQSFALELHTELPQPTHTTRLWTPLPWSINSDWQRQIAVHWQGNSNSNGFLRQHSQGAEIFYTEWTDHTQKPEQTISLEVAIQNRTLDITRKNIADPAPDILLQSLRSSSLITLDAVTRKIAETAIGRVENPLARAKAIFDWVIDNIAMTNQDHLRLDKLAMPESATTTRPINEILSTPALACSTEEIAAIFTGLCRCASIPARIVYGYRLSPSNALPSLTITDNTPALRCRAEFYSPGYGWIGVNPSDAIEALSANRSQESNKTLLKKIMFGFWENNWVALNWASDLIISGPTGFSLPSMTTSVALALTTDTEQNTSAPEFIPLQNNTISVKKL